MGGVFRGGRQRTVWVPFQLTVFLLFFSMGAGADSTPSTPAIPSVDINNMIPLPAVAELVKILGNLTDHRAFQGAEPLGQSHVDLGLEATIMHLPDHWSENLAAGGINMGSSGLPALPIPKLHLSRGISPTVDLGLSGFYYGGSYMLGLDLQTELYRPEEGVCWALRGSLTNTVLDFGKLGVQDLPVVVDGVDMGTGSIAFGFRTLSLEVLASQKLNFAEPYVGTGLHWVNGQVEAQMTLTVMGTPQVLNTPGYSYYNVDAFGGVVFRARPLGLVFAIEGAYSTIGMHYLGLFTGLGF